MLNKVILIGRSAKEPDIRRTTSGTMVATIRLALDNPYVLKDGQPTTDFIDCIVWDKQAEVVDKYIGKGRLLAVEGRIQTRSYENKDGNKVYVTEVVCNNVKMLDKKSESSTQEKEINNEQTFDISMDDLPF